MTLRKPAAWGRTLILIGIIATFLSCSVKFSFTGADIPPEAKTVSVQFFPNRAPIINPALSPAFTEALRDIMLTQTKLDLVDKNGDLRYEGTITDYRVGAVAVQGDETAAMNRVTVVVSVKYTSTIDKDKNSETTHSAFYEYPSTSNLSEIEAIAIEDINRILVQDIFNKTLGNW